MQADMTAMPSPLPATMKISTSSRRRLKYWATIRVEQSRVKPTPTPKKTVVGSFSCWAFKRISGNNLCGFDCLPRVRI